MIPDNSSIDSQVLIICLTPCLQAIIWWDLVKTIATRYITRYGYAYVRDWNFETWKNPDKWDFDGINMTRDGFRSVIMSPEMILQTTQKVPK